ncbi:hypothetical protein PybrP1_002494 [[Pythium] brassicae (nom. inval.)]|nr:hypothetical protein PybrP1_002494 [[Pythium] brassicae (nom. inval.)]
MRVHQRERESERPSTDLLSKILRRGSHAADPDDDFGGATRKSSSTSTSSSNNNNQHRPSVTGSRFSAFFFDPLYHAIMLGKSKDDAPLSSSSTASTYCSEAPPADERDRDESARRQALSALSFEDIHVAFDPYDGADPEDAMDNNELETLLEQKDDSRPTLELKAPATQPTADDDEAKAGNSSGDDDYDGVSRVSCQSRRLSSELEDGDDDDDDELHFDAPNMAVSVKKLMHRINSVSVLSNSAVVVSSVRSNQNDDDDDDDVDGDDDDDSDKDNDASTAAAGDDDDNDDSVTVVSLDNLEPLMLATTVAPTYVPSCFPQAEMPQNLSASFRRLVIDLKDDSERASAHLHGFAARRRGNSCPVPIRPLVTASAASASTSTTPTAAAASGTTDANASRARKKASFARLGPRLLGSLNFRRKKKTFRYTDEELESIEGARWKIVELAFRFGGKHRFYLVQAVNMFFPLTKYGRRGDPHATRLHCNQSGTLQWQHKRGSLSDAADLACVLQILDGRQTAVFRKYASSAALEACSFSLVFSDRTLDLETQSAGHRDWLVSALRTLISYAATQREAEERALAERAILPLDDRPALSSGPVTSQPLSPRS